MITSQQVLYIGSYAPSDQPGILVCTFDDATGVLTVPGSFAGVVKPSYLIVHPEGRWVYTVSETTQQRVGCTRTHTSTQGRAQVRGSRPSIRAVCICMSTTSSTILWWSTTTMR